MAIPSLDSEGFLPVGVHDCTWDDVKARFGTFQHSDRRPSLWGRLQSLVKEVRAAEFGLWLLIDGSFVTAKTEPNDIDLVLVLPTAFDLRSDLPPAQYNLVSKRRVRERFGFDIITVREKTLEYEEAVAFFQQVRGERSLRKGILRIAL